MFNTKRRLSFNSPVEDNRFKSWNQNQNSYLLEHSNVGVILNEEPHIAMLAVNEFYQLAYETYFNNGGNLTEEYLRLELNTIVENEHIESVISFEDCHCIQGAGLCNNCHRNERTMKRVLDIFYELAMGFKYNKNIIINHGTKWTFSILDENTVIANPNMTDNVVAINKVRNGSFARVRPTSLGGGYEMTTKSALY